MNNDTIKMLVEGVLKRNGGAEAERLRTKWEATGLLEGLEQNQKTVLARLLENQTAQILKESNVLSTGGAFMVSSGNVVGYANMAFPIIRRVFEGLFATDLISIQPLNQPAGLIFYIDYAYGNNVGGDAGPDLSSAATHDVYNKGDSVLGNPKGSELQGGATAIGGQYDLAGYGYSKVHKQASGIATAAVGYWLSGSTWTSTGTVATAADFVGFNARFVDYDDHVKDDLTAGTLDYCFAVVSVATVAAAIVGADFSNVDQLALTAFSTPAGSADWGSTYQGGVGVKNLRKYNLRGNWDGSTFKPDALNGTHVLFVVALGNTGVAPSGTVTISAAISDALQVNSDGSVLTIPSFETDMAVDPSPRIPEIDINISSTNIVAASRKLRAKWSPEQAQDLQAYFNIDAEMETGEIIAKEIAVDINNEILRDLFNQASAARYFWSAAPGKLVNKTNGQEVLQSSTLSSGPLIFTNQNEWYQTLMKTVTDVANQIKKRTLMGSGNFIVCSTEVAGILESMNGFKTSFKIDGDGQVADGMFAGTEQIGTINNRFRVYVSAHVPAQKILVGYKGNSQLEAGYVYAPYVPIVLTPVVYRPEDFAPTRGVMTRYGRKMVRSDFYGTVTVLDLAV